MLTVKRSLIATAVSIALTMPVMAAEKTFTDKKVKSINGETFTFIKQINPKGRILSQITNESGKAISAKEVPAGKIQIVATEVMAWLKEVQNSGRFDQTLTVDIALDLPELPVQLEPEVGEGEIIEGKEAHGMINKQQYSGEEIRKLGNEHARQQLQLQLEQAEYRGQSLLAWAKNHGLADMKGVRLAMEQGRTGVTLELNADQLMRLVESQDQTIAGIEIQQKNTDHIVQAMNDTNLNGWALPFNSTRGNDIGIYMTESGCAQDFRFNNYDRLAGSETNHSRNVGGIIKAAAPGSFLYCRGSAVLPQNSDLDGVGANNPPIYIINRSNGGNVSANYNTTDRSWDNHSYNNNIINFSSAGNEGNGTGFVKSPAKALNHVTVGNYNDANDTIANGSSFVDPGTGNDKPEVSAPGVGITAGGFTMGGTSMSSPHAAAFTADMMSHSTYLKYRPYLAKAKLMAGATDGIAGGFDKVGVGGIDFRSAQWSGYWSWWSGGNNSWNYFDNLDGNDDNYVTRRVYISSSWDRTRVALSWMNRGSYTYSNRNNAHPIGMDLDLRVYDPNGNYVGGSASWDNPFETVNFTPTVSGYYEFKINRYANRDNNSALRMGLYVNYYNN